LEKYKSNDYNLAENNLCQEWTARLNFETEGRDKGADRGK